MIFVQTNSKQKEWQMTSSVIVKHRTKYLCIINKDTTLYKILPQKYRYKDNSCKPNYGVNIVSSMGFNCVMLKRTAHKNLCV